MKCSKPICTLQQKALKQDANPKHHFPSVLRHKLFAFCATPKSSNAIDHLVKDLNIWFELHYMYGNIFHRIHVLYMYLHFKKEGMTHDPKWCRINPLIVTLTHDAFWHQLRLLRAAIKRNAKVEHIRSLPRWLKHSQKASTLEGASQFMKSWNWPNIQCDIHPHTSRKTWVPWPAAALTCHNRSLKRVNQGYSWRMR